MSNFFNNELKNFQHPL